jgi:hypothetical protein
MKPQTHTMLAEIERKFTFSGLADGEYEVAYPTAEITFRYWPGRPAYTPRGEFGPIDPPDPADAEVVGVKLVDGDGLSPTYEELRQWAEEWLESDSGFRLASRYAEEAE